MEIIDKLDVPRVVDFVNAKLARFDTSDVECFKLLPLPKRSITGMCEYPRWTYKNRDLQRRGYRIKCSVNPKLPLPWSEQMAVGTTTTAHALGGKVWQYDFETVRFFNLEEAAAWIAGHESFHWLRKSKQIPGRNGEPSANRYGIKWLEDFREFVQ